MKKSITLILALFILALPLAVQAQMNQEPIQVEVKLQERAAKKLQIVVQSTIANGWHMYSTRLGEGPTSAAIHIEKILGAHLDGILMPTGTEIEAYDDLFAMKVRYFEHSAAFVQNIILDQEDYIIEGYFEYGACDDESCLPPTSVDFSFKHGDVAKLEAALQKDTKKTAGKTAVLSGLKTVDLNAKAEKSASTTKRKVSSKKNAVNTSDLWRPVIEELKAFDKHKVSSDNSWIFIFIAGFGGGLLALLTPCVWPIIPMTVSFFTKRTKDRSKGIRDAMTYGISIIVIYLTLGLSITLIFGASALNSLATNAVFNILFFAMLLVFAASFLGGFEITLPSSWTNAVDRKSEETSGMLSIFLMAFTLALVSFSCTGPIIGFLLVEVSTTGSVVGPAIGMFGFALALALPFTLFALFPTWLKQMPKSGGWMNIMKVTLGFLELAFALKFLSVADLAYGWGILDREPFLALWIVIFGLLGIYLLGMIKFPHDDDNNRVSIPRFFMALMSLSFAVYMIPGLWGAPLKAISAFAPPMQTQDFNLYDKEVHAQFDDYEAGMAYAKQHNKPVMLDFTGHGCVNCRRMELAVWTDPTVSDIINEDYVLITLYVDNKKALPEKIKVEENGKTRTLRTLGDKWSYLQRVKFGVNAQPFYVLVDNEGMPLEGAYSFNESIPDYIQFLKAGLTEYKER